MADANNWSTIESDPGVFTELCERIGAGGVQVEELWALDADALRALAPVYGVVFLFKWMRSVSSDGAPASDEQAAGVYFVKQLVNNACATQALIAILLNHPDIAPGATLSELKSFTGDFPPDMRGLALSNSEELRRVHNEFARPEPFVAGPSKVAEDGDDVFHFVSFLPINGRLFELDGLKDGPIDHGECSQDEFYERIGPVLQRRIAAYSAEEIKFNLMALVKDRRAVLQEKLDALPSDADGERAVLQSELANEQDKRRRWTRENQLRRFNFTPMILGMLRVLADGGKLEPLLDAGKQAKAKKREERQKQQQSKN